MLTDAEIRGEFQENYRYSHDYWAPFVKDAQVYTLASSGYTWSDDERKSLIKEGREPLEFNIMRRPQQFFSGYLRDNINEVIYAPVEGADQKTADQLTKLGYYTWDKGHGFPTFLSGADECFKSGISLVGLQMDYSKDFINGDVAFYKRTYNSFYLDPTFTQISLKDCSFAIMRDLIDKQYTKQLLPFVDPKFIDDLAMSYRDDKFMQYHPEFTTFSRKRGLLAYDQYYKRITKSRTFLCDMKSAFYRDITDLPSEEKDKLRMGARRFDKMREEADMLGIPEEEIPEIEIRTVERPYVELNVMLNGERVYCGPDKTGIEHTYPFVPLICYMEPSIWMPSQRIQGLSSTNWSLQRAFNKRHMKILDMMDSEISTGFKYIIGSVPDPQDLQQSGQSKIIGVTSENNNLGLDAVQQLQGGGANPALIQYQEVLNQLSLTLANVTESTLGIDDKTGLQISGRAAEQRIAQGLRGNRGIMDNIEEAQQLLGGLLLVAMQKNIPPGKVERILAEKPTEQFYESEFEQYDAVIKEGVRSKSQRDAYYYELVNLKREEIVNVPQASIVKALAMSGLSDLQEDMEKQDQLVAQEAALAAQKQQMEMEVMEATKQEKLGLAEERKSRVVSNLALKDERESEAQQNIAQAALDRAKTITEIAGMRDDRILKVLEFVNQLEQQEAQGREAQKTQVAAQADMIDDGVEGNDIALDQQQNQQQQQDAQGIMNLVNSGG